MTSVAISSDGFLRFPVTIKAGRVICGRSFERCGFGRVTNGAVVVVLLCVREIDPLSRSEKTGNYVLVLIVWKLDRELQPRRGIAKRVTNVVTRRGL
jgi:hypothetical protein